MYRARQQGAPGRGGGAVIAELNAITTTAITVFSTSRMQQFRGMINSCRTAGSAGGALMKINVLNLVGCSTLRRRGNHPTIGGTSTTNLSGQKNKPPSLAAVERHASSGGVLLNALHRAPKPHSLAACTFSVPLGYTGKSGPWPTNRLALSHLAVHSTLLEVSFVAAAVHMGQDALKGSRGGKDQNNIGIMYVCRRV